MVYWAKSHPCCTCEYWNGPYKVHSDPRVIECPAGAEGICCGLNRANRSKKVLAGTHVGDWEKCYKLRRGMII